MRQADASSVRAPGSLYTLIALMAERLDTADAVAAAKWTTGDRGVGSAIADPAREAEVYGTVARLGSGSDLPETWVRQIFFSQIEASKTVQLGLMLRWRFDRAEAPVDAVDLASVRSVIDRVNIEILAQLRARRAELIAPDCVEQLARSVFSVFAAGWGDTLHRVALVRAVIALCPA
ncbi:chorismate mutase [Nocardia sp. 004]|uniref:chorismate mutase n=1 Tax=Nocardia sp. 004 TaxID=3385978 RepID=UPI0039A2CB43